MSGNAFQNRYDVTLLIRDHRSWSGRHITQGGHLHKPYEMWMQAVTKVAPLNSMPAVTTVLYPWQGMRLASRNLGGPPPSGRFGAPGYVTDGIGRAGAVFAGVASVELGAAGEVEATFNPTLNTDLDPDPQLPDVPIQEPESDPLPPSSPSTSARRNTAGVEDLGVELDACAWAHGPLPGGSPALLLPASDLRAQYELLCGVWAGVLASDYRSRNAGRQALSTRVADLDEDGAYNPIFVAPLSTAFRVVSESGPTLRAMLALAGGYVPRSPLAGRGAMTCDGWLPTSAITLRAPMPPNDAVCYISASGGGPISAGDGATDRHRIGSGTDTHVHVAGHFDLRAPWYWPGRADSPPMPPQSWIPPWPSFGVWREVYLAHDFEEPHQGAGDAFNEVGYRGRIKWQMQLPFLVPPEQPPPPDGFPPIPLPPPQEQPPLIPPEDGAPDPFDPGANEGLLDPPPGSLDFGDSEKITATPLSGPEAEALKQVKAPETSIVRFWQAVSVPSLLLTPEPFSEAAPRIAELRNPTQEQQEAIASAPAVMVAQAFRDDLANPPDSTPTPFQGGALAGGLCLMPATRSLDPRAPQPPATDPEALLALWNNATGLQTFIAWGAPSTRGDAAGRVPSGWLAGVQAGVWKLWRTGSNGQRELEGLEVESSGVVEFYSRRHKQSSHDSSFTAVPGYTHLCDTTGGSITASLPNPATYAGQRLTIKDAAGAAGSNKIGVVPLAGTIDGAASADVTSNYGKATFESDGTSWLSV